MLRSILILCALAAVPVAVARAASDRGQSVRPPESVNDLLADVPYAARDAMGLGFSSAEIGPKAYTVTVNGTAATPLSRLVVIAFARAAEIGIERHWATFSVTEFKRTSDCESWSDGERPQASIFAGRPILTITVAYEPDATQAEIRDSSETFKEMRQRLEDSTWSEQEKQATVDWVLGYCASTGVKD